MVRGDALEATGVDQRSWPCRHLPWASNQHQATPSSEECDQASPNRMARTAHRAYLKNFRQRPASIGNIAQPRRFGARRVGSGTGCDFPSPGGRGSASVTPLEGVSILMQRHLFASSLNGAEPAGLSVDCRRMVVEHRTGRIRRGRAVWSRVIYDARSCGWPLRRAPGGARQNTDEAQKVCCASRPRRRRARLQWVQPVG